MLQLKEICIRKIIFSKIVEKLKDSYEMKLRKISAEDIREIDDVIDFDLANNIFTNENELNKFTSKLTQNSEYFFLSKRPVMKCDIVANMKKVKNFLTLLLKGITNFDMKKTIDNNEDNDADMMNFYYSHRNSKDYYIWENKNEFERFIRSLVSDTFFKDNTFLKEIWIVLKINHNSVLSSYNELSFNNISHDIEERIDLSFYNIGKRNYFQEDFELHKAVMENNLRMIRKICAVESTSHIFCDMNEIDTNNNTPLMLAIKLNNTDAINVLCDHDADVNHTSFENDISPLEYVIATGNENILKILITSLKKQKISFFENNKKLLIDKIKLIPDFTLDLNIQLSSKVFFFFSSVLPTDNFKITKKGGNVRIDMSIKSKNKGLYTILLKENDKEVNIFKIDHEKKKCYDWYEMVSNVDEDEKKLKQIIEEGLTNKSYITENLKLTEILKTKAENILDYKCKKYNANYCILLKKETKKKNILSAPTLTKIQNDFENYFQEGVKIRNKLKINEKEEFLRKNCFFNLKNYSFENDSLQTNIENKDHYETHSENKITVSLKKKNIELTVWVCDSFPIKISHFLPLLNLMSLSNPDLSMLKSTLCNKNLPFETFPLKISYPLGVSFYALLTVTGFNRTVDCIDLNENIYAIKESIPKRLDENYAKEFYDKYYLEKNKDNQGSIVSDRSIEEARKLFELKLKLIESYEDELLNSNRTNNNSKKPVSSNSNFNDSEQNDVKHSNNFNCVNNQDNRRRMLNENEKNIKSIPSISNESIKNYKINNLSLIPNKKDFSTSSNLSQKLIWKNINDAFEYEDEIPNELLKASFGKNIFLPKNKPKIFMNPSNVDNKQTLKVKFKHRYPSFVIKSKGSNELSQKSYDSELSTINEFDDINKTSISHSPLKVTNWELNKKMKQKTFKAHQNQNLFKTQYL